MNTTPSPDPAPETTYKLVLARDFDAPRELVWRAWTDPAQVSQWLGTVGEMTIEAVTVDLREGGRFRIQTRREDGEYFTAAGTYLEVRTPERLVYTWDWEKDGAGSEFGELEGQETQLTVEFQEQGKGTHLVLTHEKFHTVERRDRHEGGWNVWIGKLVEFVDARALAARPA